MTFIYQLIILIVVAGTIRAIMKEEKFTQKLAFAIVLPPLLLRLLLLR